MPTMAAASGRVSSEAAVPEVDLVEVPLHDLLFVVFLFKFEGGEYLLQLSLDGALVAAGLVFDELLRDGRAAERIARAEEHVHESAGRPVPVDAVVLVEALVLDGDDRLLDILRDVLVVDPDTVLVALEGDELLLFSGRGVRVVDYARLLEREVFELDVDALGEIRLEIEGEDAREDKPGGQADEENGPDYFKDQQYDAGDGVYAGLRGILRDPLVLFGYQCQVITSARELLRIYIGIVTHNVNVWLAELMNYLLIMVSGR